jgi:hypothetical protein
VLDADDQNPRFVDEKYSAWLPDKNQAGERLDLMPRTVKAIDPDVQLNAPIEYELSSVGAAQIGWEPLHSYLKINAKGEVLLTRALPSHVLHTAVTLVVRATQADNRDRYALTTLSISGQRQTTGNGASASSASNSMRTSNGGVDSSGKLRFSHRNYTAICAENAPEGQLIVTVHAQRIVSVERSVSFQLLDDHGAHFIISSGGEIRLQKALDYEKQRVHTFRVLASDGLNSDLCSVRVDVQDVNDHDPQFAQSYYSFYVPANRLRSNAPIGELKASDADAGDRVQLSIKGPFAAHFRITVDGQLRLTSLVGLNVSQCHLIVQATDTGLPPRSTSVPVTVQFPAVALLRSASNAVVAVRPMTSASGDDDDELLNAIDSDDRRAPMERAQRTDFSSGSWMDVNALFSAGSASALALVVVLGVLLATLFIIIITLSVHVLKQRKLAVDAASAISNSTQHSGTNSPTGHGPLDTLNAMHSLSFGSRFYSASLYKPDCETGSAGRASAESPEPAALHSADTFAGLLHSNRVLSASALTAQFATLRPPNTSGVDRTRLESDSAIASDSSSNDGKHAIEKSNRSNSGDSGCGSGCNSNGVLDSAAGGFMAKLQRWHVNSSIPRRVKKLTWEDERMGVGSGSMNHHSIGVLSPNVCLVRSECELDPDVSVTPLRPTAQMYHRHTDKVTPDVTVYF